MQRAPKSTRVFLGKLGTLTKQDLFKEASVHGNIVDFLMKEQYAFVEYATLAEAEKAIIDLDGKYLAGQRIIAEYAKPKLTDEIYFSNHPRIYIGRLNGSVKRKNLLDLFARYGEIIDILMKDDFAFIEYIKPQSASQAIKEMNGKTIGSARIVVEEARPRQDEGGLSIPRIYVGHLSSSVKKSDIYYAFHKYGEIVEIMMKDDYAFVEFSNLESAYRAMVELNGTRLGDAKIQVEEAKPREGEMGMRSEFAELTNLQRKKVRRTVKRRMRASPRRSFSRSRSRELDKVGRH